MYEGNHLAQLLRLASAAQSERVFATKLDNSVISYQTFFDGADAIAKVLISKGVKPNDRVAVQVDKSIEALQLYIATVLAGAVFLPLNTAYTPSEISYFIEDASPHLFVCDPSSFTKLAPVVKSLAYSP